MRPNGGQPGYDNPEIFIRGIGTTGDNNAPLIIIDGIRRNNISQLDPTSIESISVLKDAAAVAPYGLGGANGVILITTKKGGTGAPTCLLILITAGRHLHTTQTSECKGLYEA